ncbi:MAG: hypothetical protein ACOY3P_12795 [Planctomycetota bacterium]
MRRIARGVLPFLFLASTMLVVSPGCAVVKATQQPPKKNLNVLGRGVPRTHVIAELGSPAWSDQSSGKLVDVFTFRQGYSRPVKATRALAHGAADVMTFGLWEVVGTPIETLADGSDVQLEVHYDDYSFVESVQVIRGHEVVFERNFFTGQPNYPGAASTASSALTKSFAPLDTVSGKPRAATASQQTTATGYVGAELAGFAAPSAVQPSAPMPPLASPMAGSVSR